VSKFSWAGFPLEGLSRLASRLPEQFLWQADYHSIQPTLFKTDMTAGHEGRSGRLGSIEESAEIIGLAHRACTRSTSS
jgi:hypothetical protein